MKRCSRCKAEKPLDDFHRQASSRDGHQAECKACKHERKALKKGDLTKVTRIRDGKVQEYLRGPNHGDSKTRLYRKWKSMHERCENPSRSNYVWYGAKGIAVALEWSDWSEFKRWAYASGYEDGLELDRVDPDLGYGPDNCRWITKRENVKRSRRALDPDIDVQLHAEAVLRGMSVEALIADIVTRHYAAAEGSQASCDSQRLVGAERGGQEVTGNAI